MSRLIFESEGFNYENFFVYDDFVRVFLFVEIFISP